MELYNNGVIDVICITALLTLYNSATGVILQWYWHYITMICYKTVLLLLSKNVVAVIHKVRVATMTHDHDDARHAILTLLVAPVGK